jgi:hypothetical protein
MAFNYRKVIIKEKDLVVKGNEFLIEELIKNDFDFDRKIYKEYNFELDEYSYFQEINITSLLLKDFKWSWEPQWKKIKRLLLVKF